VPKLIRNIILIAIVVGTIVVFKYFSLLDSISNEPALNPNTSRAEVLTKKSAEMPPDMSFNEINREDFPQDIMFIIPDKASHVYFGKAADSDNFYRTSFFIDGPSESLHRMLLKSITDQPGFSITENDYALSAGLIKIENNKYVISVTYLAQKNGTNYVEVKALKSL